MVGVHWPSDILGGMIVGIGSALLLIIIVRHKTKF
jgi:membrane-associated phospholipid phosphatase